MRLDLDLQKKEHLTAVSIPLRRHIKIIKLMIGRASHMARPSYCPVTELVTSRILYHLLAQRFNCARFQLFLQLQNKLKKAAWEGPGPEST